MKNNSPAIMDNTILTAPKLEFGFNKKSQPNKKAATELTNDFQTPPEVCRYMASLLPSGIQTVLEPTPGKGNLVRALDGYQVTAPEDFFLLDKSLRFDAIVMNPPFSSGSALLTNAPKSFDLKGMKAGHFFLTECMQRTDTVIALMPWFTISDSDVRLRFLAKYGLKSITALPRKTFQYVRIQTVVIHLEKGFKGTTEFRVFENLPSIQSDHERAQWKMFDLDGSSEP
jgi:type I restriction-modification system DNA methylase subunit